VNATLERKLRSKKIRDQQKTMIGTVPYLGLYLSDLTYIDSANENYINLNENDKSSQKLINFDKHRKQFDILVQIKLFQSAANAYTTLHRIQNFKNWFDNIRIYNDEDSWNRSFQIEPKETIDNTDNQHQQKLQEDPSPTYRSRPLKAFPSQISLESLATTNNQILETTVPSGGSLRSTPSLTSLDKISFTSIHSFPQHQPSININAKKIHSNHSRSSSASSFLTNASSSQGYMSAQASPANSVANCTVNNVETETLIAKVQLVGRNDLLYKKVRIAHNERTPSVLKSILDKFGLDPSTYERYCIEQQLPNKKIVLLDHCNVFYALVRQSDDEQVELVVREKTRQELDQTKTRLYPNPGHNRTPSGFSISSTHSR
jgi:ral guanine nucleotide dissociation stimulator-like 1